MPVSSLGLLIFSSPGATWDIRRTTPIQDQVSCPTGGVVFFHCNFWTREGAPEPVCPCSVQLVDIQLSGGRGAGGPPLRGDLGH